MTFHFRPVLPLLIAVSLLAGTAQAAQESLLILDQSSGGAAVQRNGKRLALNPEDALQEQDQIVTDRTGRMKLNFARHGFVEIGANSEVGVERLPFATYARDLKSIFSVGKGYFRVVWKHPQLSTSWPLFVTLAGHRISLTSGEYFFSHTGSEQRACVAAGQMDVQPAGSTQTETIKPPACVRFVANTTPQLIARNPDDWIAVRRGYDIDATAATLLAADAAAPASRPPPSPARAPIIAAAPAAVASAAPVIARAPVVPTPQAASKVVASSKPKPPVVAAASAATGGDWALNIASYSEAVAAEQAVAKLRGAGYEASSQPAVVNGRNWYRVQLRGFADQAAARAAALQLKTELGLQNIWVLKP